MLRADTLEELAGLCKINPAPLAGTVQKYKEDCARDDSISRFVGSVPVGIIAGILITTLVVD